MRRELINAVLGYGRRPVIRAERIVVTSGRSLGIYGPNGAGKTTLLRGILGLLTPMEGTFAGGGSEGGGGGAYLPQHRELELHWPMSGFDAAALFASARGRFGRIVGGNRAALRDKMRLLDVETLADRPFARLSGGQQQRLLLAGLLATRPQLLVLDEPTDGLDAGSIRSLLAHLRAIRDAGEAAIVLVSHDVDDLLAVCDEVAILNPAELPDEPASAEVVPVADFTRRVLHLTGAGA